MERDLPLSGLSLDGLSLDGLSLDGLSLDVLVPLQGPLVLLALQALLALHLAACTGLWLFGAHRVWLLVEYLRGPGARRRGVEETAAVPTLRVSDGDPPRVTVQLPLYNESAVAERLIDAVASLRYPRHRLQIQVLDDSDDDTAAVAAAAVERWRALGVDAVHLRRGTRSGFKAGALAHGLAHASGELIAIFDADFVPEPDFLEQTVPAFADPGVSMVQARWGHLNRGESLLTRAQAVFLDAHFTIEHGVRSARGRFFNFNGTAGVWRKSAIVAAGGWDAATLTEDLDLSFRAQLAGCRFTYLDHVEVPAELPADASAFKGQQHRWAKGSLQTARRLLPSVWRARLPLLVKLDATLKLTQNLAFLFLAVVVATMPLVALARAASASPLERAFDLATLIVATTPVAIHFLLAQRGRGRSLLGALAAVPLALGLGAALSVNNARAVLEGLFGRGRDEFVRTPKAGSAQAPRLRTPRYRTPVHPLVVVELTLGMLHLGALVVLAAAGVVWMAPFLLLFGVSLTGLALATLAEGFQGSLRRARASVVA